MFLSQEYQGTTLGYTHAMVAIVWKALGGQIIYNHCPQQSLAIVCSN